MNRINKGLIHCIFSSLCLFEIVPASAQVLLDQTFESLSVGTINGQAGFGVSGQASSANVVNNSSIAFAGSQYLEIQGPARTVFQTGLEGFAVGTNDFVFTLHVRVTDLGGAFNGLELILNADGGPDRMVHTSLSRFGDVRAVTNDNGTLTQLATISAGEWYLLNYAIDPSTLNYEMSMIRDSDSVVIIAPTTVAFDTVVGGSVDALNDIRFTLADEAVSGNWLVDNLSFTAVPEPSTSVLFGIAATIFILVSHRRYTRIFRLSV